jgi:hypothetical protein
MTAPRRFCWLFVALPFLGGCGSGHVAISGMVVYDDGSPVEEGTVCGELVKGGAYMVQGNIKNGAFSLGTSTPGDGVKPGEYKILIQCRALGDAELAAGKRPAIVGKYAAYETSGLTLDATAARSDVKFVVSRPGKGKAP